jgi:hypothetical protein
MELREIDALAAEKVLGWTHVGDVWTFPDECGPSVSVAAYGETPLLKPAPDRGDKIDKCGVPAGRDPQARADDSQVNGASVFSMDVVPSFTTDIAAAWTLVEKIGETLEYGVWVTGPRPEPGAFAVFEPMEWRGEEHRHTAEAATAPLAITLAALKAVGVEVSPATSR